MNNGFINVHGVTPETCMPHCDPEIMTQVCETDCITVHCKDPDIQEVVRVNVTVSLRKFKIIRSPMGKKLIIHALKNIEVTSRAGEIRYTTKLCVPFFTCVLLECIEENVEDVKFIIEDIDALQIGPRKVSVSTLILVIPHFNGHAHDDIDDCKCSGRSIRCDIKIKPNRL